MIREVILNWLTSGQLDELRTRIEELEAYVVEKEVE